jgi:hypothetical protein|tara:strand:+ start:257 stop:817 length:561 start_codon:yes stop_codon:yes gene_type:complete
MKLGYLALLTCLATFCSNSIIAATNAVAEKYAGEWVINVAETDLLREELDEKPTVLGGPGRVSVSVLGLPIPTGRSKVGAQSPLTAADPAVLRSRTMFITVMPTKIQIDYPEVGGVDAKEVLRKGHYRGRDSKWSQKKIEQKYKTTERKVAKTWSIRGDGRLLAVVTIKNPGSKKRTFSRVFDKSQ